MSETADDVARKLGLDDHKSGMPRWAKYALGVVVVGVAVLLWPTLTDETRDVRYVTAPAMTGDLRVTVIATGTVEPTNLVEISSELSGTLDEVRVDFNDQVVAGDVLAELDTTKLEASLAVSKAALDSAIARVAMARATLEEAKTQYDSVEQLEERGVAAHQTFVTRKAAYVRAQAELQSALADRALAEANLDLTQAELDKACICSPITGVVLDRAVDPGQIVAASLSAPILFTLAEDLTKMELQVDIDEADIGRTAVGNKATFTVDAYDERLFPAEISEIRFAPETVEGVVTYKAVLTIDNADLSLRPGMTATAEITVEELSDVLTVPNAALRYVPPAVPDAEKDETVGLLGMLIPDGPDTRRMGDDRTVWVLRDGMPVEIPVVAGATDGIRTEIIEGALDKGDEVIVDRVDA
ncbi:efflux RND transporter periplasmic adaptor subunit [Yoonia sediminilitoris]|uniref:HlyD family secretion protein n=1 Tax=Yoonia sediminilitoris TaxID=1286148 RepID=A0A2T6KBZ7_9RHOB|nr:efflux RND transporter periplasmic adaptor subunit [Yoonia sediminilitoris]PUB12440.1 HlyD family secretion protein [Yoonia sediminilitoris]RCW93134.1 HlyD family secretion protein [Yoonia sediminilitoris]